MIYIRVYQLVITKHELFPYKNFGGKSLQIK